MEVQILRYYLKVFSLIIFTFCFISIFYSFYVLNINIKLKNDLLSIEKGETIDSVLIKNAANLSALENFVIKKYYLLNFYFFKEYLHYGEFFIEEKTTLKNFIKVITRPSNVLKKITIVEGWSKDQLNNELSKYFSDIESIPYDEIIADTYFITKGTNFKIFLSQLKDIKKNYFYLNRENKIYKSFSENKIMIIGSLLEKEGLDKEDKKKISSVIFNRLNSQMKLQIDATVLYAITNGKYNLKRKLMLSDLDTDHPFNTYKYYGLPPKPISYVGKKTLDIIFSNYETDFLFYFFNNS